MAWISLEDQRDELLHCMEHKYYTGYQSGEALRPPHSVPRYLSLFFSSIQIHIATTSAMSTPGATVTVYVC